MRRLILGSASVHRRRLLGRLGLEPEVWPPDVDESARPGENARDMAMRLAMAKATAVARFHDADDAVIIGSDQTAVLGGRLLRKPGDRQNAIRQLLDCRGETVSFHTACVVVDASTGRHFEGIDDTRVHFRCVEQARIERYVDLEKPYDCAGAFKVEGLGIALFRSIDSTDPTALQGLPLIWLCEVLSDLGLDPLDPAQRAPTHPGQATVPGAAAS